MDHGSKTLWKFLNVIIHGRKDASDLVPASQQNHGTHFYGLKAGGHFTNTTLVIVRLEANGEIKRAQFK